MFLITHPHPPPPKKEEEKKKKKKRQVENRKRVWFVCLYVTNYGLQWTLQKTDIRMKGKNLKLPNGCKRIIVNTVPEKANWDILSLHCPQKDPFQSQALGHQNPDIDISL